MPRRPPAKPVKPVPPDVVLAARLMPPPGIRRIVIDGAGVHDLARPPASPPPPKQPNAAARADE
eukprot:8266646-Alexandrium_andersonii.AAC.1